MTKARLENIILYFEQRDPYGNDWTVTDNNYDCDCDSDGEFYSIAPLGTGATKEEALMDYIEQLDDLTKEEIEEFFNEYRTQDKNIKT